MDRELQQIVVRSRHVEAEAPLQPPDKFAGADARLRGGGAHRKPPSRPWLRDDHHACGLPILPRR
eukprot:6831968-Prymnesium_polylepis.1